MFETGPSAHPPPPSPPAPHRRVESLGVVESGLWVVCSSGREKKESSERKVVASSSVYGRSTTDQGSWGDGDSRLLTSSRALTMPDPPPFLLGRPRQYTRSRVGCGNEGMSVHTRRTSPRHCTDSRCRGLPSTPRVKVRTDTPREGPVFLTVGTHLHSEYFLCPLFGLTTTDIRRFDIYVYYRFRDHRHSRS